jgi:hypothetical protein
MLSNLLNHDVQISKMHLYMWKKTVLNRLLDFRGVLDNFEINCTYGVVQKDDNSWSKYVVQQLEESYLSAYLK